MILPETAARTGGLCMPCVHANAKRERDEYVRLNRRDVNQFDGVTDIIEVLKLIHAPREFDVLVNWIPYPTPSDQLYASLSAVEAARLAEYAENLLDAGYHGEAEQICLCLAAFTDVNLDAYLRRSITQEVFSPGLAFHRAPPDVRDDLLARVETDAPNRDAILSALAWIGDSAVVDQFARWRKAPPAWCASLYIPPQDYSRGAGWELTDDDRKRNLYFSHCTHLVKGQSDFPASFRAISQRSDHCPWCSSSLTNLFEVDLASCGIVQDGASGGAVTVATCEICTGYAGAVFGDVDSHGNARWSRHNIRPQYLPGDPENWCRLPMDTLCPAESRPPLFGADHFLPTTFSQLGGHPCWVQDADYPKCPECTSTMMFLAQIDHQDIQDLSEGIFYGFICQACRTTATSYQQT